jgi:hypothetical protein
MRHPFLGALAVITIGSIVVYQQMMASPVPRAANYDGCKLSESEIRQFWVRATLYAKDEASRTQVAQGFVSAAENLCRSGRDMLDRPPVPLPPELQKMAR